MARKPKKLPPVRQNLTYEASYRRLLKSYVKKMDLIITKHLFKLLDRLASKYTTNDDDVLAAFAGVDIELTELYKKFTPKVIKILTRMKDADKKKFYRHLDKHLGISLENILERENIKDSFSLAIEQNLDLIKTLTEKQLSRIKNVVLSDLRAGNFSPKTIRDTIVHDFGISSRHADFIARDQSHKMTSTLSQLRYQNLGITKYVWVTAHDRRVRGTPKSKDGKYPNAKPSHYAREGKTFEFKNPPEGGAPGEDYNCRCYASPVMEGIDF